MQKSVCIDIEWCDGLEDLESVYYFSFGFSSADT